MWQHHYLLYVARVEALRAEADRDRRWRLEDIANGRSGADGSRPHPAPAGEARAALARSLGAASRAAARLARRLDERVAQEPVPSGLARDT